MISDHKKGCGGLNYWCTCGYDDQQAELMQELVDALKQAKKEIEYWGRHWIHHEYIDKVLAKAKEVYYE